MKIQRINLGPGRLHIKMIPIHAGNFVFQGVPGVPCNGFKIAATPFTNGQFRKLLELEPKKLAKVIGNPLELLNYSMKVAADIVNEVENCPLVFISQVEAEGIAKLLGCRLPTELEWERAAAGKRGRKYPWGNTLPNEKTAVFKLMGTRSVTSHPAGMSSEGLYDLTGNVWEWTSSSRGNIDLTNPKNPQFPQNGIDKILRGGSWSTYSADDKDLSSSGRGTHSKEHCYNNIGFRLAMDLKYSK